MPCAPCESAKTDPLRHDYTNGCDSCQARSIAALGFHRASINAGRVVPEMSDLLHRLFNDPAKGWTLVREWGVLVDKARTQQK